MKSPRERSQALTVILFSLGYASYFLSKAIFVLCAAPLVILLAPFPQAKNRVLQILIHRYLRFFTRSWLPWLGIYRVVEVSGIDQAKAARPAICVANHRGFMDSLLVLGLLPGTGVLIKARDTRQPMYALLARHFDLVSVDRNSLNSISSSLDKCRQVLAGGKNLLVFPEGARAVSGRLQRFNRLAFQLAVATGLPVLPIIIHSTHPFMAKLPGSIFPRGRNEYRIRFLDPEVPHPDDDPESLCSRVHRRTAKELKALDAGTVWDTEPPNPNE